MRLILVRHGQTPSNVVRALDTAIPGPGLTDLGHEQARSLVPRLAQERIDRIYVSTLTRTHLTAAPLAQSLRLEPVIRDGLREIDAGELEMSRDIGHIEAYLSRVFSWIDGDLDPVIPGTTATGADVLLRFDDVVNEAHAQAPGGTAVLVSHGAVISTWAGARGTNVDADFVKANHVENTGTVILTGDPGAWAVERWQDVTPL